MVKTVGIIGVGSPFGADNLAEKIIKKLLNDPSFEKKDFIEIAYYDRPGLFLLEIIKKYKTIHFVDAINSHHPAGMLHRHEDITALLNQQTLLSSHNLGLGEALLLAKSLNCLPEKVIVHGIEIDDNSNFLLDSSKMKQAQVNLVEQIKNEFITNQEKT